MASLRDRLLALRDDLRQRLAEADHLDTGLLQILAATEIVLTALDRDGAAIGLPNA
jgi:hypothetical protein